MEIIKKYFPHLSQKQVEQFEALKNLYTDWNNKINVISRKDMDNFYEHHVLHSLSIACLFPLPDDYDVMDLGSGGGFPGLPLAIFFPNVKFCLVDSIKKKLTVVDEISAAIGLTNVSTQHKRAEQIQDKKYDVVLSRAVAPLKDLCRWSKHLIKSSQTKGETLHGLICLKGGDLNKEIGESGCNPDIYDINMVFKEDFFKEKYILYVRSF